jgi:tetratricopeptide (TPR) repeat protein
MINFSIEIKHLLEKIAASLTEDGGIFILDLALKKQDEISQTTQLTYKKGRVCYHYLHFEAIQLWLESLGFSVQTKSNTFHYQALWAHKTHPIAPKYLDLEWGKAHELMIHEIIDTLFTITNPQSYLNTLLNIEKKLSEYQKKEYVYNLQIAYGLIERNLEEKGMDYLNRNFNELGKFDILGHRLVAKMNRKLGRIEIAKQHLSMVYQLAPYYAPVLKEKLDLELEYKNWQQAIETVLALISCSGQDWVYLKKDIQKVLDYADLEKKEKLEQCIKLIIKSEE